MSPDAFVAALKQVAHREVVRGALAALEKPPGRRPDPVTSEMSRWFNQCDSEDRKQVERVIDVAAAQAVYNVLLVLDGLLAIEPGGEKSQLQVLLTVGSKQYHLNDPNGPLLSGLFKELS